MTAKENWIWMPHPAHFICGERCGFKLATYVGNYIVSTVGEYLPDETVREVHANVRGITLDGVGDERLFDFIKKCGYFDIGVHRKYETMVFHSKKSEEKNQCCPYLCDIEKGEVDFHGCNDSTEAYENHMRLCNKWCDK